MSVVSINMSWVQDEGIKISNNTADDVDLCMNGVPVCRLSSGTVFTIPIPLPKRDNGDIKQAISEGVNDFFALDECLADDTMMEDHVTCMKGELIDRILGHLNQPAQEDEG